MSDILEQMKSVTSINDLTADEIKAIVDRAIELKTELKEQRRHAELPLAQKSLAMIFDKASLRTRLSFESGMTQLGGHAIYLAPADIGLGKRETVHDTAIVVSSMVDVIIARVSSQADVETLAKYSSVPIINAMTDQEHPCQILADLQTLQEHFGKLAGLKLAYVGDADTNVVNSLSLAAEKLGLELSLAAPKGYQMSAAMAQQVPSVKHFDDPKAAVAGANVVITDTWISMGKEAESADRVKTLRPYQVDAKLMALADKAAIFMHCLPAYRGKEVAEEVIDGPQSVVFAEAENRQHAQKALLLHLLT